ncbi:MAG: hypothetical protein ACXVKA_00965 [Acidimicrobiia bacterium]
MTVSDVHVDEVERSGDRPIETEPPEHRPRRKVRVARRFRPVVFAALVIGLVIGLGAGIVMGRGDRSSTNASAKTVDVSAGSSNPALAPHVHNHDEVAEAVPDVPLDAATRAQLAAQLTVARSVAMRFPTVADATAAGYVPAGGFAPETGAHYQQLRVPSDVGADGQIDPNNPASLIFDGNNPSSKIVGLMYEALGGAQPAGFAGPNDHWHRHSNVCVKFAAGGIQVPFAADSDVTPKQCSQVGGTFMKQTIWMVHAWVVPSWESPLGVFSHNNPNLVCADGTVNANPQGFCAGT